MTRAFTTGWLTVVAHAAVAIVGMTCVTVLAAVHVIAGSDAVLVTMATLGITGPSLGRPVSLTPPANRQLDG